MAAKDQCVGGEDGLQRDVRTLFKVMGTRLRWWLAHCRPPSSEVLPSGVSGILGQQRCGSRVSSLMYPHKVISSLRLRHNVYVLHLISSHHAGI